MIGHIPDNEEIRDREEADEHRARRARAPRTERPSCDHYLEERWVDGRVEHVWVKRYWQDFIA